MKTINYTDEDGIVRAVLNITKQEEHYVEFELRHVVSWGEDEHIVETRFYLNGTIKWDGCSHIWFRGEDYQEGKKSSQDSYYHLCGIECWKMHVRLMEWTYKQVSALMPDNFDSTELWK